MMQDAKQRQMKKQAIEKRSQSKISPKQKKICEKSQKYVFDRFTREYENILNELEIDQGDKIDYDKITQIMFKLGFINHSTPHEEVQQDLTTIWKL